MIGGANLSQALSSDRAESKSGIKVRVYNHARVPGETLERAKAEAAAVFRNIKVGTAWVDCDLPGTRLLNDPGCNPRHGPTDLVLRIVPRSMTERYGFRRGVLGFALNTKKSRFGYAAYLFFDRLQGLPGWRSAGRPGWDRKQLRPAVNGTLNFSSREGKRIRAGVRHRIRARQRHPGAALLPTKRKVRRLLELAPPPPNLPYLCRAPGWSDLQQRKPPAGA